MVCDNLPDFDEGTLSFGEADRCFFVDKTGLIFKPAPSITGTTKYNRYYMPDLESGTSSSDIIIGTYATSTAEFIGLQTFYENARVSGIRIEAILFKDGGEYEAYARNPSDRDGTAVIYFNNLRPLSEQLTNLALFWVRMIEEAPKSLLPKYDSIDVRNGSNIFYRQLK